MLCCTLNIVFAVRQLRHDHTQTVFVCPVCGAEAESVRRKDYHQDDHQQARPWWVRQRELTPTFNLV